MVPVFLAELAPYEIRGSITGRNELAIVTGQLAAFVVNAIIGDRVGSRRRDLALHVRGLRVARRRAVRRNVADA